MLGMNNLVYLYGPNAEEHERKWKAFIRTENFELTAFERKYNTNKQNKDQEYLGKEIFQKF